MLARSGRRGPSGLGPHGFITWESECRPARECAQQRGPGGTQRRASKPTAWGGIQSTLPTRPAQLGTSTTVDPRLDQTFESHLSMDALRALTSVRRAFH
jgi:hypothetical protein